MLTRFDTAHYIASIADLAGLRDSTLAQVPEVAFVGRSNAGKSSAINAMTNRKRLAYASKLPGRTQMLNFFGLGNGRDPAIVGHLVDLPGYGFAKVDPATRQRWNELVGGYLVDRPLLRGVVLVIDSRRGAMSADEELIALLTQRDPDRAAMLHVLLSKIDQINTTERRAALAAAQARIGTLPLEATVQLFSARGGEGVETLQTRVAHMLAGPARSDRRV
ncbi:MAG TPA: ribosome biogenesis GTP-binding protein YihA/YsxC [Burkholderiaceae bacterium]|nr:ribosome biogenesis GTP-binding protein YihA/YsxC [Burkholderiaceae bacterium]